MKRIIVSIATVAALALGAAACGSKKDNADPAAKPAETEQVPAAQPQTPPEPVKPAEATPPAEGQPAAEDPAAKPEGEPAAEGEAAEGEAAEGEATE